LRFGFSRGPTASSAFIATGPPGFGALVFLQLAKHGIQVLPRHTPINAAQAEIIYFATVPFALSLYGLAIFLYFFALIPWLWYAVPHVKLNPEGGFATLFPPSGFVNVSVILGDLFGAPAFYYVQVVFAGLFTLQFLVLFVSWWYRLFHKPDPQVLKARAEGWDDMVGFFAAGREANEREQALLQQRHSTPEKVGAAIV
jgi:hypothetical protein